MRDPEDGRCNGEERAAAEYEQGEYISRAISTAKYHAKSVAFLDTQTLVQDRVRHVNHRVLNPRFQHQALAERETCQRYKIGMLPAECVDELAFDVKAGIARRDVVYELHGSID
jgi:hypothetical protein